MSDVLTSGQRRPSRRWTMRLALAGVLGALVVLALGGPGERRPGGHEAGTLNLSGMDVGSGLRADGSGVVVFTVRNDGIEPVRVRELRLVGAGLGAVQELSDLDDPLPAGGERQFEVALQQLRCPDALEGARSGRLEIVAETATGARLSTLMTTDPADPHRERPLAQAVRLACDLPTPGRAANALLNSVAVVGDEATGVLVLQPSKSITILRLLPSEGLRWTTNVALPVRGEAGRELRVVVRARRGDCTDVQADMGTATIGLELELESAPALSYVEPPEVIYVSPVDAPSGRGAIALAGLRTRLCVGSR